MPRTEQLLMNGWEFALNEPIEENFKSVYLPHDWVVSAPFNKNMKQGDSQGYRDRWSIGWYRKTLHLNEKVSGSRYLLDFGGIFENSAVKVNGIDVGGQKYGYSSFRLDITDAIIQGNNKIEVKVDNTIFPVDRWYSGGGIYRTVKLIEVESKHLDEREIIIRTNTDEAEATVTVLPGIQGTVKAVLTGKDSSFEACGDTGKLEFHVPSPMLWSAEEPNLYTLTLYLLDGDRISDEISMHIGIRKIEFLPNKGMYVNGKKVVLKGACLHQDIACRGIAAKKELWRERLEILKDMGCNSIRASHHMHSSEFLDLCDEMGFYVYSESFDKWTAGLYGRYFAEHWKDDVACMVKRDRNRPSIVIWGTGNEVENQGQQSMLDILKMMRDYILTLDDTRPITYAMNPHFKMESNIDASKVKDIQKFVDVADDYEIYDNEERFRRIKRIADIVDIISCNYQEQWFADIHRVCPDKLILGTEVYQFFKGHRDQMQNFTNENPALASLDSDYVIGSMIWTGYDYLGESMIYPAKGWSGAFIRTNNEKRFSCYLLQSYWDDKPMVHFSVMDYSLADEGVKEHWDLPLSANHWHFPQYKKTVIPYMIATNCDEIALFLNGKRFYTPKPADFPNGMITGFMPYQPGKVKVIGYRNGEEVCSHITVTPGPAVQLEFDKPESRISAEEGYEMLLTVRAKDEDGNPYFRESSSVLFKIDGNAEILAVDNGNLMSNEPYSEPTVHMYHGCASVLIRFNGKPGRIAVHAFAEGMRPGMAIVNNQA